MRAIHEMLFEKICKVILLILYCSFQTNRPKAIKSRQDEPATTYPWTTDDPSEPRKLRWALLSDESFEQKGQETDKFYNKNHM